MPKVQVTKGAQSEHPPEDHQEVRHGLMISRRRTLCRGSIVVMFLHMHGWLGRAMCVHHSYGYCGILIQIPLCSVRLKYLPRGSVA